MKDDAIVKPCWVSSVSAPHGRGKVRPKPDHHIAAAVEAQDQIAIFIATIRLRKLLESFFQLVGTGPLPFTSHSLTCREVGRGGAGADSIMKTPLRRRRRTRHLDRSRFLAVYLQGFSHAMTL